MKKYSLLFVCLLISSILLTGCHYVANSNKMVNTKRRFEKYLPDSNVVQKQNSNYINLGEGPKLKYNRDLGPADVNFDFKIVNPY